MSFSKLFTGLFFAGLVAYAVIWELPTLKWSYDLSSRTQGIAKGEDADMAELMKGPPQVRWWKNRTKLNDTFNTSFLSDARMVSVELPVALEDLLHPEEDMPEDAFKNVYVAARAPAHLMDLCRELLNTIAVKCDLSKPNGKIARDGVPELRGHLRFIPADAPGELPQTDEAEYTNLGVSLSDGQDLPFTTQGREVALKVAGELCRALRVQVGNCVVTRVNFRPQWTARVEGPLKLRASAVLTVYADPADIDQAALKDELNQLHEHLRL